MYSITKINLPLETIQSIVRQHLGSHASLRAAEELTEGCYNTAYRLDFDNGFRCILKVAPPDDVRVLRYEKDLMRAEVEVMALVRSDTQVPVPQIYQYDTTRRLIENDFYLMEFLPGTPLNKLRGDLSQEAQRAIEREAGQLTRQINHLQGERFGYYAQMRDSSYTTWREAFETMVSGVLADGLEMQVSLPLPYPELAGVIARWYGALEEVTHPRLVHWDLWDGNIFVDRASGRINGLIDYERALWGDPLMEVLFGDLRPDSAYMQGYGCNLLATENQVRRRVLYNIYLFLIMVIEPYYREYKTKDQENWARVQLQKELSKIA
jgi:aminoglycoside phosphotransferase (APT) family kinase protein